MKKKTGFDTRCIHAGQSPDPSTGAVSMPIYATSTYAQESPGEHKGYAYGRGSNPTRHAFERCLADLENGTHCYAFASGVAASNAALDLLPAGSHIVACHDLYGGTIRLFNRVRKTTSNLDITYVNMTVKGALEKAVTPKTKMIWIESPTNPMMQIIDLAQVASIAKKKKILTLCDNTFATPALQTPLDFGFDIVLHSGTKYIGGHSDLLCGALIVKNQDLADKIKFIHNSTGGILGPFESFLALRGLKTLALRMERHNESAAKIAEWLTKHKKVRTVLYPGLKSHPQHALAKKQMSGFGGMITILIKGGTKESKKFLSSCKIFTLAESLGGVESLIQHPGIMTHASIPKETREATGITDDLIRISVGIENVEDLIADLDQALEKI